MPKPLQQQSYATKIPLYSEESINSFLNQFTKINPNTHAVRDNGIIANDQLIKAITQHFYSNRNKQNGIKRLLQILMFVRYVDHHKKDAYEILVFLYKLLRIYDFTFEDLFNVVNTSNNQKDFYAPISDVIIESMDFIRSHHEQLRKIFIEIFQKSKGEYYNGMSKDEYRRKFDRLNEKQQKIITQLNTIERYFQKFKETACYHIKEYLEEAMEQNFQPVTTNTSLEIVDFIFNYPFLKESYHKTLELSKPINYQTQKELWRVILKFVFNNNTIEAQLRFIDAAYTFTNTTSEESLQQIILLLNLADETLRIGDKLHIITKINVSASATFVSDPTLIEALFNLNFSLHGYQHFNSQCNSFLRRYFGLTSETPQMYITAEIMNNLWRNPDIFNQGFFKKLCCTNFESLDTELDEVEAYRIYQWLLKLKNFAANYKYSASDSDFHFEAMAIEDNILKALTKMLSLIDTSWMALPQALRFRISILEPMDNILIPKSEMYCGLSYENGKYIWFSPQSPQGEMNFLGYQSASLARHILKQLELQETQAFFSIDQYTMCEPHPKPMKWSKPVEQPKFVHLPLPRAEPSLRRNQIACSLK